MEARGADVTHGAFEEIRQALRFSLEAITGEDAETEAEAEAEATMGEGEADGAGKGVGNEAGEGESPPLAPAPAPTGQGEQQKQQRPPGESDEAAGKGPAAAPPSPPPPPPSSLTVASSAEQEQGKGSPPPTGPAAAPAAAVDVPEGATTAAAVAAEVIEVEQQRPPRDGDSSRTRDGSAAIHPPLEQEHEHEQARERTKAADKDGSLGLDSAQWGLSRLGLRGRRPKVDAPPLDPHTLPTFQALGEAGLDVREPGPELMEVEALPPSLAAAPAFARSVFDPDAEAEAGAGVGQQEQQQEQQQQEEEDDLYLSRANVKRSSIDDSTALAFLVFDGQQSKQAVALSGSFHRNFLRPADWDRLYRARPVLVPFLLAGCVYACARSVVVWNAPRSVD